MLTILSARSPVWNDSVHTSLNLFVTFEETAATLGEVPFTASPYDCEAHGRDLFARAIAREFGAVAEPSSDMIARDARMKLSTLSSKATSTISALKSVTDTLQDAIDLGIATEVESASMPLKLAEIDAWRAYRVYLSRIEAQPNFPAGIEWPIAPSVPFELP